MKTAIILCLSSLLTLGMFAQQAADTLPSGVQFPAQLITHLDARKAKPGDEVKLEVTANLRGPGGVVVLPQGAKLIGAVTAANDRKSGDGESRLSFLIERAEWHGGSLALHAVPTAVTGPKVRTERGYGTGSDVGGGRNDSDTRGGNTGSRGSNAGTDSMGMIAAAIANELKGVEVKETSDPRTGTVVSSTKRDVSLPTGTVVTLRQIRASVP